ncbi:uncharacterized protein LOC128635821 [Bombina bombina]|uniref:uncharacterized protein LOC128635821 n=1 Tax=Bombina bombina TaxID=8345 RepID=UPI00235A58FF|nr:uncharacterized protein LOC128635821 [Bombina bombina]
MTAPPATSSSSTVSRLWIHSTPLERNSSCTVPRIFWISSMFQPINAPSDENLCLSQPRDSTQWYLEEDKEDEALDYTRMSPTSLTPEVATLSSEVATPASEVTSQSEDVISSTTEDISNTQDGTQTPPNIPLLSIRSNVNTLTSECKTFTPVEKECETRTNCVIRVENTTREESPNQQKRVMKEMCDQFKSCRNDSPHASGPNVRTAISQNRFLDPRMMWTGSRRDTSQSVQRLIAIQILPQVLGL